MDKNIDSEYYHYNIELYVLRDLPLNQLLDGVKYGLEKLASEAGENQHVYEKCRKIFEQCISKTVTGEEGEYLSNIALTSFHGAKAERLLKGGDRYCFYKEHLNKPICDLGFITSSRIIFDASGAYVPKGKLNTTNIIEAFNPRRSDKVFFPEYNISTRQMYQFNEEPIEIIEPTDPPKEANRSLFFMLLPSILSLGIMIFVRMALMSGNGSSSIGMIILSATMGVSAAISTAITWKRQKIQYEQSLRDWRNQYQTYINNLFAEIWDRQDSDAQKMDELYPDMLSLINPDENGVYSLNENLYSRAPQDEDFLTFRLGLSNEVENKFQIKGGTKDVVFSETSFDIIDDDYGNDKLRIFLRSELSKAGNKKKENLCKLPATVAYRYQYMKEAPLLYSLKNKGALGVVDHEINSDYAKSKYFISRMIFELCYYHSPENLQFVIFFEEKSQWNDIENIMNMYKFMPHFRGLFSDKSQFVFDANSAGLVLSNLLTIMGERRAAATEGAGPAPTPHIVFVVFNEYGLKEHAFAQFLPSVPESGEAEANKLGLSFVFGTKYKEYLPAYCDDVVSFDEEKSILTPHLDINRKKEFYYTKDMEENKEQHIQDYTAKTVRAFRFFSAVYYAQISQNGKVPSTVSAFEILNQRGEELETVVKKNWGLDGPRRVPSVTESLRVPVGKTETDLAYLDLHEKGDGPHMLVAGTTGSGKTETIITFLLGLCTQYRPDELNLLLVDMKGGGFTKRIGHLPHVVGTVTDVDGDENGTGAEYMLGRFLYAMKAEIKRRKLLFNRMYVDSIDAYIKACNDIEAHIDQKKISGNEAEELRKVAKNEALSHLILVVDEFTELKRFSSENSELDFMSEITTIARVGRSLGFHIILISQNIEGAITEDIRVNSRARLCLKVATRQASKDMIGTDLAASPYMPGNGRAYLLVGTGSKFEYFQSGYSGSGTHEDIKVEITMANKSGAYTNFYRSDKDNKELLQKKAELKKTGDLKTQLEAINEAICGVYADRKESMPAPHMVFRAPLPSRIALDKNGNVVDIAKLKGGK